MDTTSKKKLIVLVLVMIGVAMAYIIGLQILR